MTGILFTGFFAQLAWNGVSNGLLYGDAGQLGWQVLAALAAPTYAFTVTFVLLRGIALVIPLRVTEREEALGMDIVHHGEEAYASGEGAILVAPEGGVDAEVPLASPT
jgi:Amt family ammonium transporter